MDFELTRTLNRINRDFYRTQAESFSATRRSAWPGWERCASIAQSELGSGLSLADIGCGNMRLENFLARKYPGLIDKVHALDSEPTPVAGNAAKLQVKFHQLDLVEALLNASENGGSGDTGVLASHGIPRCDVVACFGVMHHIPGSDLRINAMRELCHAARPGGLVMVSLWNFLSDPGLSKRAEESDSKARSALDIGDLEPNDRILGWQDIEGAWRYCHSFDHTEVHALVERTCEDGRARLVDSFDSDGRTGSLNIYLVLQVL